MTAHPRHPHHPQHPGPTDGASGGRSLTLLRPTAPRGSRDLAPRQGIYAKERRNTQQKGQTEGTPGKYHPQEDHREPQPKVTDYEHREPAEHGKEPELSHRRKPPTLPYRQTKSHTGNRRSLARNVTHRNTIREQLAQNTDQPTGNTEPRHTNTPNPWVWRSVYRGTRGTAEAQRDT